MKQKEVSKPNYTLLPDRELLIEVATLLNEVRDNLRELNKNKIVLMETYDGIPGPGGKYDYKDFVWEPDKDEDSK